MLQYLSFADPILLSILPRYPKSVLLHLFFALRTHMINKILADPLEGEKFSMDPLIPVYRMNLIFLLILMIFVIIIIGQRLIYLSQMNSS